MTNSISKKEARRLALNCQGLAKSRPFGTGHDGARRTVEQLGYVQIDTISVIERAHHHTFWTRCQNYSSGALDKLQAKDRRIFEYWSHAAAYLPIDDFRFCQPRMRAFATGEMQWFPKDEKVRRRVLDHITLEGPAMSKDFKPPPGHKSGPWWQWKPAKIALEQLFMEGKLMVVRRNNFQKIYDLTERVLPAHVDTTPPSSGEYSRYLIERALQAHGVIAEPEIGYLRKGLKQDLADELKKLVAARQVVAVQIEGLRAPYYSTEDILNRLSETRIMKNVHILSPFDNAVIQRKRTLELFDFDYQIECYVPAPKRIYGYFCLPVLWGEQFIGRIDTKAERASGKFLVRNLVFEAGFKDYGKALIPLTKKIQEFAEFNGCSEIHFENVEPRSMLQPLKKCLENLTP